MLASLYLKLAGLAIILALIGGGYWYVSNLRSEVAQKDETILTLNERIADLGTQLQDQNEAITSLQTAADAHLQSAQAALAAASAAAATKKGAAQVIYRTLPAVPNDDCKSALDLMNGVTQ